MQFNELKTLAMTALSDMKAENIVEVDVKGKTSVTDLMVVVSGTSSRHVKSIAGHLALESKRAGYPPIGVEGEDTGEWVLVDLGDIVVHVMMPEVRDSYALEKLWSMSPKDSQTDNA